MIVYSVKDGNGVVDYLSSKKKAFAAARWASADKQTAEVTQDVTRKIDKDLICWLLTATDGMAAGRWCKSSVRIARFRNGRKTKKCNKVLLSYIGANR